MRFSQQYKRRRLMSEINIVPYIDVMLVLLVIFMITAPMLTQGVKVELPQANANPVESSKDHEPLLVNIDSQGRYYIDIGKTPNQPVTANELLDKATVILRHKPNTPVLVGGDRSVPYGEVVKLMALLQQAGAPHIGLITEMPVKQKPH
ncbi:biopolymer transport protein ExbD/TolR [Candidatus Nitrosoglobus terrae]|uniref:Tol-Pal system protein TolR n=1 Tax=Candidatus Nitrosoglobus terrae TaxID=1630141 RepID=A0A1Q2SK17_9GAMM|nr:protein TolR [Candidatus Nitrosoglobus terrae]BAW79469.1 biopolymer transport protein ExbD/TolR [Candidatus Nitrosoglobus terrae]